MSTFSRRAKRAGLAPVNPIELLKPPSKAVDASTVFDAAKSYRVQLSSIATYLGTPLSPMHVHVVTGTVAQAVRSHVASYDLA